MSDQRPFPAFVFKYQPVSLLALGNLEEGTLWFSDPANFNDPFDCAADILIHQIQKALDSLDVRTSQKILRAVKPNIELSGDANEIISFARRSAKEAIAVVLQDLLGVCCFSEKVDDLLMWGHYADSHRGMCLKFSTEYEPVTQKYLKPVSYCPSFPQIDLLKMFSLNSRELVNALLVKSDHWSYEAEWRAFHKERNKAFAYERSALVAVYFGAKMPQRLRRIVANMLLRTDTEFFEMSLLRDQFSLKAEQVIYTPLDLRTKEPGQQ